MDILHVKRIDLNDLIWLDPFGSIEFLETIFIKTQ
jgi:hypothetical protein